RPRAGVALVFPGRVRREGKVGRVKNLCTPRDAASHVRRAAYPRRDAAHFRRDTEFSARADDSDADGDDPVAGQRRLRRLVAGLLRALVAGTGRAAARLRIPALAG